MDIHIHPEFAARLLDRMTEDLEYKAVRLAQMGVDVLNCGDDMGTSDNSSCVRRCCGSGAVEMGTDHRRR